MILDNQVTIKNQVIKDSRKSSVHQITIVDSFGAQKNYNILGASVEDAVQDVKKFIFDTERLSEGKDYQITMIAGGYFAIDYTTKYYRKFHAYKTIKDLFSQDEKDKLIKDLQSERKSKN